MKGLVINLGLKSIRAIIFDENASLVVSAHEKIDTFISSNHVEQDADQWWEKGLECIKKVVAKESSFDFMTVTSSSACIVPVNKKGKPLSKVIMVSDKRSSEESKIIQNAKSFKNLKAKSDPYYPISKILWIKRNQPKIYEKTHKFLSPNDFFICKLTGKFATDEINATKFYTVSSKYPKDLLAELKIDKSKLPQIENIGYSLELSKKLVEDWNLKSHPKVILTTYDAICSFFGTGAENEGDTSDMSGTVTSLRVLTKNNLNKNEDRVFEIKYNKYNIIGASNNLGGGLIEWLFDVFYHDKDYKKLEELKNHFAAKTGLIFLPYLMGERAPIWDNHVRGAFLGIERFHRREDKARAVLESTGYVLKDLAEAINSNKINIERLFVSGGLAKIDIINQIKADVLGKKIYKLRETESTSLGAYFLARKSKDKKFCLSFKDRIEKIYIPDMEKHKVYNKGYILYKKAYLCLKDFHDERKKHLDTNDLMRVNL